MMTLLKLRRGDYSLVEEKIPQGAPAIGVALKDLGLKEGCVIAAIIREGKMELPRGITTFQQDDEVLAIADHKGIEQMRRIFTAER
jgi:trk system potassium uptake protein TrkA